jgi:hypothetical protein
MIGLEDLIAQLSAMNLAKSLIVSEKTIVITAHLCSEMAVFGRKSYLPASLIDPILKNKECFSIVIKDSNYRPFRVSEWIVLSIIW